MAEAPPLQSPPPRAGSLGASARATLLWGGGFTLLRDIAQFGLMLILVRLLTPSDYGTAALVQAIIGVAAALSFQVFSSHALQIRNPDEIDWQAHFTAAVVLNTTLAVLVLCLAFGLSFTERYQATALPLAALSIVFLVEVPGALRHRMMEANHDWKRFRLLLMVGTLLGLTSGLVVGLLGGGVWALIVQVPMLGLPAAIDLFVGTRFKPDWTWSWARYRETAFFGCNRVGAGLVSRLRILVENGVLAATFDLTTLGLYSRAMGLANLLVGRIGGVAMSALYPVVTRAELASQRFQRLAGLVLRGVAWTTIPIGTFLALTAADTVQLLYGGQWGGVVPLLVLAAATTALISMANALGMLLLANGQAGAAFWLDVAMAFIGMLIAVVCIPWGPSAYIVALGGLGALLFLATMTVLIITHGLTLHWALRAFVPALVAVVLAISVVSSMARYVSVDDYLIARLLIEAVSSGIFYVFTLRLCFSRELAELLEVAPYGTKIARLLFLKTYAEFRVP